MMPALKIAIIGAGSASFGPNTLAAIMREPDLQGSEIALIDKDEAVLEIVVKVAERMSKEWGAQMNVRANTDRRELLPGSDFVIVSIESGPREKLWQLDWEIPVRHGLRQPYAENGGPGGLMHACRQIPQFMNIALDMEQLCPEAWLINYSNPLPRITRALTKYSKVKVAGKCHQINAGYALLASLLRSHIGEGMHEGESSDISPDSDQFDRAVELGRQHFQILSAGLNHFIWLLEIRDKQTGEDLYPILREVAKHEAQSNHPLTMDLFRVFGYCPIAGDAHLSEYLPWVHDPVARPWKKYDINIYDWAGGEVARTALIEQMAKLSAGADSLAKLRKSRSEGAVELITAIGQDDLYYDEAVNIPNNGSIAWLPEETVVEIPAMVDGRGIRGLQIDDLPAPIAELMRREANLVELAVDAAVTGDKQLALQALLLDPMINDIDRGRAILDDYLQSFAPYLPQFEGA
jgi:alpha-galactosidase